MQLSQHPDCVTKPLRRKTHGHKEGEHNMQIRIIKLGACCLAILAVTGIVHASICAANVATKVFRWRDHLPG